MCMKLVAQLSLILFFPLFALAQKGWEAQWNELHSGARKDGKVVVMGSADPVLRQELPAKFKARFGVGLEYIGGRGGDNFSRLRMERQAGLYTTDAVMSGMANMVDYYKEKTLDPLLPALVLPEVVDPSKWKSGRLWFMDPEEKYILRLYNYVFSGLLYFNTKHAKPEDFKSVKELINPKWRGKISLMDPTISGPGEIEATQFYLQFGEEFVKKLYVDQKPAISRDKRQIADWLAHGTYPVSLSAPTEFVVEMKKLGLPVEMVAPTDAPGSITAGNGLLALINKSPRPNAARLFVNWLASKEGVEILGRARGKPSTRNDIEESYALPWEVPRPGLKYLDTYGWEYTTVMREKVNARVKEILRR
ncbi:MAG: ABC transporter substrate-binding protein [Candidatus Binatia bacterium]